MPGFYMPFSARVSPYLDGARRHTTNWARQMGMLDSLPGLPGIRIWTEPKLVAFDSPLLAACIHADASPEELDLSSEWLTWGTYGDDYFPTVFGSTRNMAGAKAFNERLSLFMPLDCGVTPPPANAFERGWQISGPALPLPCLRMHAANSAKASRT